MDGSLENLESRITARPRDVVRLFQCPKCEKIFRDPVATPCGRHACLSCVIPDPTSRARWQRTGSGDLFISCPFAAECGRSHHIGQNVGDSEFGNLLDLMEDQLSRWREIAANLGLYAHVDVLDADGIPVSSRRDRLFLEQPYRFGKLLTIWDLATLGVLKLDNEVIYSESLDPEAMLDQPQDVDALEWRVLRSFQRIARDHVTCKLCYSLIQDPATAVCSHAFCRSCLCLALQTSSRCPLCLWQFTRLPEFRYQEPPSCQEFKNFVETFYMDEQLVNLQTRFASLNREWERLLLIPCRDFIPMPHTAARLHIRGSDGFYLPAVKRAIEHDRVLGIVQASGRTESGVPLCRQFGTLVHIRNARWRGENYEVVVDCISAFKIHSYTLVHNIGIMFAVTKPILDPYLGVISFDPTPPTNTEGVTTPQSTPDPWNSSSTTDTRALVWKMISSPI